jgi:hypothetical protein
LLKGFRGDYKLQRVKVDGKELFKAEAVKNASSHLQDALQALAVTYDRPRMDANIRNRMGGSDGKDTEITYAKDYPVI